MQQIVAVPRLFHLLLWQFGAFSEGLPKFEEIRIVILMMIIIFIICITLPDDDIVISSFTLDPAVDPMTPASHHMDAAERFTADHRNGAVLEQEGIEEANK